MNFSFKIRVQKLAKMAEAEGTVSRPSVEVKLYIAALKGDYGKAEEVKYNINRRITKQGETTLHIAALARQKHFVEMLVKKLNARAHNNADNNLEALNNADNDVAALNNALNNANNDVAPLNNAENDVEARNNADNGVEALNNVGNDALYYAAASGDVDIAKILLKDNSFNVVKALNLAATLKDVGMVKYLYSKMKDQDYDQMSKDQRTNLLINSIRIGLYDMASKMLKPELAKKALDELASKPSLFAETKPDGVFNTLVHSCTKIAYCGNSNQSQVILLVKQCYNAMNEMSIEEVSELLFEAAEAGNVDFLIQLIHFNPDLIWMEVDGRGSIFHVAVEYRHENIFSLIFELGGIKDLIAKRKTKDGNTILHLAAKLAPAQKLSTTYGPALQMYQELLWFKEVEKIVPTLHKELDNSKKIVPQALFEESHEKLREAAEKWMKGTAESSMLVATLIATVMFTAALSVPGGFNNSKGRPLLRNDKFFTIFSISDAVGLLFSSASILMFLSVHTSRFGKYDFLKSVPRFMIGNAFLCISITAMMVAFSAIFVLYYHHQGVAFITFVTVACVPILYLSQTYRLFWDFIFHHRIGPSSLFKPQKRLFR